MKRLLFLSLTCISLGLFGLEANAQVSIGVSISARIAPPPLPVYVQPYCPGDGYIWTPGYWAFDDQDGYYWVPGVWVLPPQVGYYWTPCYWGFDGGYYRWHSGYWGPQVGFYGGINYGYGYGGYGYYGGIWQGSVFRYNTVVTRVNTTVVHNVYVNRTVIHDATNNRVSYNGGPRGVNIRPTATQQRFQQEQHVQATRDQINHQQSMSRDRNQWAAVNHNQPQTVTMTRINGDRMDRHGRPASPNAARMTTPPTETINPNNRNNRSPHAVQPEHARNEPLPDMTKPRAAPNHQPQPVNHPNPQPNMRPEPRPVPHHEPSQQPQHPQPAPQQQHMEHPRPQEHQPASRPQPQPHQQQPHQQAPQQQRPHEQHPQDHK